MTNKATIVVHGFYNLTPSEQQEVIDEINRYRNERDYSNKKSIERKNDADFNRITLGPVGTGCPCCGR